MSKGGGSTGLSRAEIGKIKKGEGKAIMKADEIRKLAPKYNLKPKEKKA